MSITNLTWRCFPFSCALCLDVEVQFQFSPFWDDTQVPRIAFCVFFKGEKEIVKQICQAKQLKIFCPFGFHSVHCFSATSIPAGFSSLTWKPLCRYRCRFESLLREIVFVFLFRRNQFFDMHNVFCSDP